MVEITEVQEIGNSTDEEKVSGKVEIKKKSLKSRKRKKKAEKAGKRLLKQIYTLDTKHLIAKVGFILNQIPRTRDNDKLLTVEIYKTFYRDFLVDGDKIKLDDLLTLPKSYEMQRYRAHIQNVLGLFRASPDVQKRRKVRRKEWREDEGSILSPPVEVFTTECGSDSPHLVVASLWIYDRLKNHSILSEFRDFKEKKVKNHRLIFSNTTKRNIEMANEFFDLILKFSDFIGFKAHIFHDYKEKVDSVHEAYLEHVLESMDDEVERNNIKLPKSLSIIKSSSIEDEGNILEHVRSHMNKIMSGKYDNNVFIDQFFSIDTESSPLLQITDFFAGSLHYLYGNKTPGKKLKDKLACEIMKKLKISTRTCTPKRGSKKTRITII
ncbi:MAG: DUF3800 domain-containing protein [Candidatus Eremiobacteraeota bacterium]|nr:DUF3800 domain-containing protein [Candidatus Eremiobacteraeota bacterium]